MDIRPSISDEFVQAMALIHCAFPKYDLANPYRHVFNAMHSEALQAIRDGLSSACRLCHMAQDLEDKLKADRSNHG